MCQFYASRKYLYYNVAQRFFKSYETNKDGYYTETDNGVCAAWLRAAFLSDQFCWA